jgi:hypothetical protein
VSPRRSAAIATLESKRFKSLNLSGQDLLLIDERVGRKVARERGLAVRGTLGVFVQLALHGRPDSAKRLTVTRARACACQKRRTR